MTGITVERRPGGTLAVTGLLAHPELVEAIAALLVDGNASEIAEAVAEYGVARLDEPEGSLADGLYGDSLATLVGYLESVVVRFAPRDLAPIVDAVAVEDARKLVTAA